MEGPHVASELLGGGWRPIEPDRPHAAGPFSRRAGVAAGMMRAMSASFRRAIGPSPSRALPCVALLAVLQATFSLVGAAAAQPLVVERVDVPGEIRGVRVHVPAGLAADPLRPPVIAFHGGGSHARAMADRTGLRRTADAHGFVVAFPEGSGRLARLRTWNASECCGSAVEQGVDDVGFVVAAIAPVAGAMALDPDLVRVPVPVLHMHGTDDRHAPFEGGVGSASIEGGGHTWPGSTARERWLGPSTLDVDANELMWAYFEPRTAAP